MDNVKNPQVVLVTGGSGYLGKELVIKLKSAGYQVYTISKNTTETDTDFSFSLSDERKLIKTVSSIKPNVVFHLAANINRNRDSNLYSGLIEDNVMGTLNLLKSLQDFHCHLIYTSTGEVYGNNCSPFNEEMIPDPVSPYSSTKLMAEELIRTFCKTSNIDYTIFRLFNFYGGDMPEHFFISQMVNTLLRKENFKMTAGEQVRDFIHINDLTDALMKSVCRNELYNDIFNLCSGKNITIKEIANMVVKIVGTDAEIDAENLPYRENEIMEMLGNPDKLRSKMGDLAVTDFNSGLSGYILNMIEKTKKMS